MTQELTDQYHTPPRTHYTSSITICYRHSPPVYQRYLTFHPLNSLAVDNYRQHFGGCLMYKLLLTGAPSLCLSTCPPSCLVACPSPCLVACPSPCLAACPPPCLSASLPTCLSDCLSTCLSDCLPTCMIWQWPDCLWPSPTRGHSYGCWLALRYKETHKPVHCGVSVRLFTVVR